MAFSKGDCALSKSYTWKGGRSITRGYIQVKSYGHPRATKQGYVLEHTMVMEESIGRYLHYISRNHPKNEVAHHINGNKADNRIENLSLMTRDAHSALHNIGKKRSSRTYRQCLASNCTRKRRVGGLCSAHAEEYRKSNTPLPLRVRKYRPVGSWQRESQP